MEKIAVYIIIFGTLILLFKKFKNAVTKKNNGCSGCSGCGSRKKDCKEACGGIIEHK